MDERRFTTEGLRFNSQALPVFVPDAGLWPRVVAGELKRRRTRRIQRSSALVAAAVFAVAALVFMPHPQAPLQLEVAAVQRESQALESQWHQVPHAAPSSAANLARVRMIDANLQAAYDRGASARDIAPLWRARNTALRGLIAHVRDTDMNSAQLLTRI